MNSCIIISRDTVSQYFRPGKVNVFADILNEEISWAIISLISESMFKPPLKNPRVEIEAGHSDPPHRMVGVVSARQKDVPPDTTMSQAAHSKSSDPHPPTHSATTSATWDRMRQLGASFISPLDLLAQPVPSSSNPYNSIYLPQLNIPSSTMVSPPQRPALSSTTWLWSICLMQSFSD